MNIKPKNYSWGAPEGAIFPNHCGIDNNLVDYVNDNLFIN